MNTYIKSPSIAISLEDPLGSEVRPVAPRTGGSSYARSARIYTGGPGEGTLFNDDFADNQERGAERENPYVIDIPVGLWVATALIFGFLESLTLALALAVGNENANPLMASFSGVVGGRVWVYTAIKTALFCLLFFVSYHLLPGRSRLVPALLSVTGCYLVLINLIAFFTVI